MTVLSRIVLDVRHAGTTAAKLLSYDAYQQHRLIWRLFPHQPSDTRAFLFRLDAEPGRLKGFVLSPDPPVDASGTWLIETKPFAPNLHAGQPLAFSLRANPTVARRREKARSARHDVVMDAKRRVEDGTERTTSPTGLMQRECARWLMERGERAGFETREEGIVAERYLQHRISRRSEGAPIRFSSVDLKGVLTVVDPDRLIRTLLFGLGPCKGFGCGLLLVRPSGGLNA